MKVYKMQLKQRKNSSGPAQFSLFELKKKTEEGNEKVDGGIKM